MDDVLEMMIVVNRCQQGGASKKSGVRFTECNVDVINVMLLQEIEDVLGGVSVLNFWVKFFAFDKVSIPMITHFLESKLLTLTLISPFPHMHTPRQGQENSYNDFNTDYKYTKLRLGLTIEIYQVNKPCLS